ncbi:MAG: septum formation inhibitor Maf [Candidatus Tokpelaia sp.]|uniref:Maf family protein n=1 Tax=Candidatus Tokpelaia sp. TaxID=2233777 RepID=UPI00123BF0A0|nr:Maf family protein [Candidatus Tokpelaia sp.]KAA6205383.1 MAG: septum formation inhibitor Maf [Candidatus Tokpelaia sp.]KAA6206816.1 MAG: septum formation inhibitor Maf [Candidatus Tokpelaia sp.]KAA6406197.1 septum formation inhibitor Maf [Candidatus Tokpelaia sp.]
MREELILASKSPSRAQILRQAGLEAAICGANIDERAVEADFIQHFVAGGAGQAGLWTAAPREQYEAGQAGMGEAAPRDQYDEAAHAGMGGTSPHRPEEADFVPDLPPALAQALAKAKAEEVSRRFPEAVIIGCDQILELDGAILHKAANEEEACQRLSALSGKTHRLHSAFTLIKGGVVLSGSVETAQMTMRSLSPDYIRSYLKRADKSVLSSVGVYQIEGAGIRLFEAIKGDYWAIIGLPLLPLLRDLRRFGAWAD